MLYHLLTVLLSSQEEVDRELETRATIWPFWLLCHISLQLKLKNDILPGREICDSTTEIPISTRAEWSFLIPFPVTENIFNVMLVPIITLPADPLFLSRVSFTSYFSCFFLNSWKISSSSPTGRWSGLIGCIEIKIVLRVNSDQQATVCWWEKRQDETKR